MLCMQADERGASVTGMHRGSYYQDGSMPRSAAAYRPHEYSAEHAKHVSIPYNPSMQYVIQSGPQRPLKGT